MTFNTKRWIKWGLLQALLLASCILFWWLGAGFDALGLSAICLAAFNAGLWPGIVLWGPEHEVKHGRPLRYFLATLIAPALLFPVAALLQAGVDAQISTGSEQR